jgi:hypothetical protein
MKFDTAVEDVEASREPREYHLIDDLEIAGDGPYAAVRPPLKAYTVFLQASYSIRQLPADEAASLAFQFLNSAFLQADVRQALIESGNYEADDDDIDPDLNAAGVQLARSNQRLAARYFDAEDEFGPVTMVNVMLGLLEHWAGKDVIGSRPASSPPSKQSGKRSTGSSSRAASTRSSSRTGQRRGGSRSSSRG